jgi:E2F/DP family winged-helix DNA-binding domain
MPLLLHMITRCAILGEQAQDSKQGKRRLYDVTNVLEGLGLLERISTSSNGKGSCWVNVEEPQGDLRQLMEEVRQPPIARTSVVSPDLRTASEGTGSAPAGVPGAGDVPVQNCGHVSPSQGQRSEIDQGIDSALGRLTRDFVALAKSAEGGVVPLIGLHRLSPYVSPLICTR